jgi:hypothetical protein
LTKYEPKTAFEVSAQLTCRPIPVFNGWAIDRQCRWVIITSDGRITTRDTEDCGHVLVPRIRDICIVSSPTGGIFAIAPGMEDLAITHAKDCGTEASLDDTWALMSREVSSKCTEWIRRYLGIPDLRLMEIDFEAFMEDEVVSEVGDDLAYFGESDFAAVSRRLHLREHSLV